MIDDSIEDDAVVVGEGSDVLPGAEIGPDVAKVAHRESVVGGGRKEGEKVDEGEVIADPGVDESAKSLEGRISPP